MNSNARAAEQHCNKCYTGSGGQQGSAVAWWLMPRTPNPEVGGSSPTRVKPCCVIELGTFTPQKVLVIPRKRWLRPNMTEKLGGGGAAILYTNFLENCDCVSWVFLSKKCKVSFLFSIV